MKNNHVHLLITLILTFVTASAYAEELTLRQKELMQKCIQLAYQAKARGNYPFAALLVKDDKVVLISENTVNTSYDRTAHSVLNLIQSASRKMGSSDLRHCTIYCSTEPCPMCSSAIYWAGIPTLVYGCPSEVLSKKTGETYFIPCRELLEKGKWKVEVIGPVLEGFAAYAHEDFWRRHKNRGK